MADEAENFTDTIKDWKGVLQIYRRYRNCDDGSIAEGNAEAIARILVDKWKTLPELDQLSAREPGFESFVLSHINATLDTRDLRQVAKLSAGACPQSAQALCKKLQRASVETSE